VQDALVQLKAAIDAYFDSMDETPAQGK
jgi:hypothetical protein